MKRWLTFACLCLVWLTCATPTLAKAKTRKQPKPPAAVRTTVYEKPEPTSGSDLLPFKVDERTMPTGDGHGVQDGVYRLSGDAPLTVRREGYYRSVTVTVTAKHTGGSDRHAFGVVVGASAEDQARCGVTANRHAGLWVRVAEDWQPFGGWKKLGPVAGDGTTEVRVAAFGGRVSCFVDSELVGFQSGAPKHAQVGLFKDGALTVDFDDLAIVDLSAGAAEAIEAAHAAGRRGDWARAAAEYQHALALDPERADASWYLARAYEQTGLYGAATGQYVDHLRAYGSDKAVYLETVDALVALLNKTGIPEKVPQQAIDGLNLGRERVDAKDPDGATVAYLDALVEAPWWSEPYYGLAVAYETKAPGDRDYLWPAIKHYEWFLVLAPADDERRDHAKKRLRKLRRIERGLDDGEGRNRTEHGRWPYGGTKVVFGFDLGFKYTGNVECKPCFFDFRFDVAVRATRRVSLGLNLTMFERIFRDKGADEDIGHLAIGPIVNVALLPKPEGKSYSELYLRTELGYSRGNVTNHKFGGVAGGVGLHWDFVSHKLFGAGIGTRVRFVHTGKIRHSDVEDPSVFPDRITAIIIDAFVLRLLMGF